jgi:hypothetical protein
VFLVGFTWDIPTPSGWTGFKKGLLAGWNVSGVFRYESGRPLRITMTNDMGGFLFNGAKRPDRTGADGVAAGGNFDPATDNYFNRDAWSDPGPLTFGNAPRADGSVRGFATYNEDLNISKTFYLTKSTRMRLEAMAGNIFNRVRFCDPATNWSAASFGVVATQCNVARSIQFGARVDF